MLPITDIAGNTELLTNIRGLTRTRKVNGEKSLTFFVISDESNAHSFGMVDTEAIVELDGEEYVIKTVNEKNVGVRTIKEVGAVHKFFCDLMDGYQYEKRSGSMTFTAALDFIFGGTGYTYVIVDSFLANTFGDIGDDNRLSLFKKVLEAYGAEFYVIGTQVFIKREIGNDTDFQFRYAHNVKTIDKKVDSSDLATYIRGYGKQNDDGTYVAQTEYTSPNSAVLGIRHAPAVRDERYTDNASLLARIQSELKDEPDLSITIDFADLRASGYTYEQPNEGDYGFIIYEPMSLDVEARIVEIKEEFDANLAPIKTAVTLSNFREGMADILTRFGQTSKQLWRLMNGQETLPYNVLDDAVKAATEALKSAQTELEFNNGIIARSKTDPNHLVLLNSAGIGISTDGGATFSEAITYLGVNTSVLTAGQINANNISVRGGTADAYTLIDANGLSIKLGAISIERPDGYKVVNTGILQNSFTVFPSQPAFQTGAITKLGQWYQSPSTNRYENIQRFSFKHDSRYLRVLANMYVDGGAAVGNMGSMAFDIFTDDEVTSIASAVVTETQTLASDGDQGWRKEILLDMGTPTGRVYVCYWRMWSSVADWNTNGNVRYIVQEG